MTDKPRILWLSDSSCATRTGFAKVSLELLTRLQATGRYEIAELGIGNPPGTAYHTEPQWKVYHSGYHQWCEDVFPVAVADFKPQVVIALLDTHMSAYVNDMEKIPFELLSTYKGIAHLPIDGSPVPGDWVTALAGWSRVACIHPFGERELKKAYAGAFKETYSQYVGLVEELENIPKTPETEAVMHGMYIAMQAYQRMLGDGIACIPHGVDHSTYKQVSAAEKRELREAAGFRENDFVFCYVGRNSLRKMVPTLLQAFAEVCEKSDRARLVLGCKMRDKAGCDLRDVIREYGIPAEKLLIVDNGLTADESATDEQIAALYQLSDCFVSATYGGGFEMCHMESMACGLPQIGVRGAGSITDMVDGHGILVGADRWYLGGAGGPHARPMVQPHGLALAMTKMLKSPESKREEWSRAGIEYAAMFSWDATAEQFVTLIDEVLAEDAVRVRPQGG